MSGTAPTAARKDRPRNARGRIGKPFEKGNPGRPKGIVNERAKIGQEAAAALEGKAWDVAEGLLKSSSWRARDAGMKVVLAYAIGLPRQKVDLTGFGDLAVELAAALKAAREARALNGGAVAPPAPLSGDRVLVRAELLAAEVVSPGATSSGGKFGTCSESLTGDNPQLSEARNEPADPAPEAAS